MVVPGGPAYKPVDGKRIEKTDNVLAIDPDGKSGFKAVTPANVVSLLRGPMIETLMNTGLLPEMMTFEEAPGGATPPTGSADLGEEEFGRAW